MRIHVAAAALMTAVVLTLSGCGGSKSAAKPVASTTAPPADPIAAASVEVTDVDTVLKAVDEDLRDADSASTTDESDLTK